MPTTFRQIPEGYHGTFVSMKVEDAENITKYINRQIYRQWNDKENSHYAPKIAEYMAKTDLPIAIVEDFKKANGSILGGLNCKYTDGLQNLFMSKLYFGDKQDKWNGNLLHEIIHNKGGDEFQAFAGMYSADYLNKYEFHDLIYNKAGYFSQGMPTSFDKYFITAKDKDGKELKDKDGYIIRSFIQETENEFKKDFKEYGNKIIGNEE